MKNQKIRDHFFANTQETIEYFADINVKKIKTEDEQALRTLLIDHATKCLFSILVYIDGGTEEGKNIEIVNEKTGKPIAQDMLHELYSNYQRSIK